MSLDRKYGKTLLLLGLVVFFVTGCDRSGSSQATEETEFGKMKIIFSADAQWLEPNARKEMESALSRYENIDLVYAHNDPQAHGAWLAARQEGQAREEKIDFIGIDANPDEGKKYVREKILDATLEYPTGATEAIDVALLILNGIEVPKDIILGTTLFTPENIEEGGLEVSAPGPEKMVELRKQHADILQPDPANQDKWTIGMSQSNLGEPWRVRMNREIEEAAGKYPQLKVLYKDAQNESQTQRTQVEEFLTQGVDLLLVSPKETIPLTPPVQKVYNADIPVIVLDRQIQDDSYTTFIGANNTMIGTIAGQYAAYLLNGEGNIVELKGLMTTTPAQERHNGFLQGLKDWTQDSAAIKGKFSGQPKGGEIEAITQPAEQAASN